MSDPRRRALLLLLAAAALCACATPAVVMVSPSYDAARTRKVTLAYLSDYPGAPGSGEIAANTFEKYLLVPGYRLVERRQAEQILKEQAFSLSGEVSRDQIRAVGRLLGVDALVLGGLTDYSGPRDQTVMIDMPVEQTDPVYGQVVTTKKSGDTRVRDVRTVVTGYATTRSSQLVSTTQTVPAHAGLAVRLVDVETGEVLWSASASAGGDDLAAALEEASARAMRALAKRLKEPAG
jgi:curli biogenesis system outer membrane secretion channel CsgG